MLSMLSRESTISAPGTWFRRIRRAAGVASVASISLGVAMLVPQPAGAAHSTVGLGTAASFAVLAGSGITNTGTTVVTGDIGSFPTPTETGLGSMVLTGVDHGGDAVTQQAKNDLTTAYNAAAGAHPPTSVATELGGRTLTPGVYNGATLQITGTLTLDTLGDPDAVFVFQTPETLITASNSAVVVLGGATACNVFWQVGSSATLGAGSALVGTVMALTSITATTAATVQGRLLALNGAVTLDSNTITNTACAVTTTTSSTVPTTSTSAPTTPTSAPTTPTSAPTTPTSAPTTPGTSPSATEPPTDTSTGVATSANPSAPTQGTGTGLTSETTSSDQTTTTARQRPDLPFTGSDPRVPLAGGLVLLLGVVLLGASTQLAARHDVS